MKAKKYHLKPFPKKLIRHPETLANLGAVQEGRSRLLFPRRYSPRLGKFITIVFKCPISREIGQVPGRLSL
jgi:hypothetical protein